MKESSHLDNPDLSPERSPLGLTDQQRQALAKVYRLLLGFQDGEANGDALQNHTSSADSAPANEQPQDAAESACNETDE